MKRSLAFLMLSLLLTFSIAKLSIAQMQTPPVLAHPHNSSNVKWELDGSKNGDSAHNHMKARGFGGYQDELNFPYSSYACWNNHDYNWRLFAPFNGGHCFVDSIDPQNTVTFSFQGSGWTSAKKNVVRTAFDEWNSLATFFSQISPHGVNGNRVGIEFVETGSGDIKIEWKNLSYVPPPGTFPLGQFAIDTQIMRFNSNSNIDWDTSTTQSGEDDSRFHLLTVALHEVGHAVGLEHQLDSGDLMLGAGIANPASDPRRDTHFSVDNDSAAGAYELYGQPPGFPAPPTDVSIVFVGCNGEQHNFTVTWDSTNLNSGDYFEVERLSGGGYSPWYEGGPTCTSHFTLSSFVDFRVRVVNVSGVSVWVYVLGEGNCGPAW